MKRLTLFLALALTVCSTAMAETLTAESEVGTVGILAGREAMVVDLGGSIGKVAVATKNLGATGVNDYGTIIESNEDYDPSSLALTDGWYVPTIAELAALKNMFQLKEDNTGYEYKVEESVLTFPGCPKEIGVNTMYVGKYLSSSKPNTRYHSLAFAIPMTQITIGDNSGSNFPCAIRPFHKMPLVENCRIYYTSSDGNVVTPNSADFNVSIVSNDYKDGQGVIIFDGELTSIGKDAFSGKSTLTSVTLPASVTSIKDAAFYECASLTYFTFADNSKLEMIAENAFIGTAISGQLDLPASLKSIGFAAFSGTQITAVTIPALVTTIGRKAFAGCSNLATLNFADGSQLETIEKQAFEGTQITAVTIPAKVRTIDTWAFYNCRQLSSLTFAEGSELKTIGGSAFNSTAISGDFTFPASVTSIQGSAFENCQLSKIYMSLEDLSNITNNAFNSGAVILVPINLYETYKTHFDGHNKVEVTPLKDWQEYAIGQIETAMKQAHTIPDTDKATIEGYIAGIRDAESFDEICTIRDVALALINQQKAFEEKVKDVLGDLGTGHTGPAIRVTGKNGKSIMLFELDKVEFVNIDVIGQGEAEATGIGNVRWIQLWEGGPKFAEYNLGATSATEFGGYYTWGGMYKNGKGITWDGTYNEGSSVLSGEADTATNLWGSNWRMPTIEDFNNLLANCNAEWTTIDGVNGCKFTGKGDYKYNSIFLPAAGSCDGYPDSNAVVTNQGDRGYYFTSTPKASNIGHALMVTSSSQYLSACNRNTGNSIRAVLNEE